LNKFLVIRCKSEHTSNHPSLANLSPDIFFLEKQVHVLQVTQMLKKSALYLHKNISSTKIIASAGDIIRGCIEQNLSGTSYIVDANS
jgi:hypothetical protein